VLLWLVRKAFLGHCPLPLVHIDTTYKIPVQVVRFHHDEAGVIVYECKRTPRIHVQRGGSKKLTNGRGSSNQAIAVALRLHASCRSR
jgi:3'-phosphoadenosine 5'-phosphosulfate sulfotransferase (PAPS reductase)/FAD synthetase